MLHFEFLADLTFPRTFFLCLYSCSHPRHSGPMSRENIVTWPVMHIGLLGFFCVKKNWTKRKTHPVYQTIHWFRPEQVNYSFENNLKEVEPLNHLLHFISRLKIVQKMRNRKCLELSNCLSTTNQWFTVHVTICEMHAGIFLNELDPSPKLLHISHLSSFMIALFSFSYKHFLLQTITIYHNIAHWIAQAWDLSSSHINLTSASLPISSSDPPSLSVYSKAKV